MPPRMMGKDGDVRMSYLVDNAIIMAAGVSSRFAPLSYERPKALIDVKGEVLIERQIRQLKEAGIEEIIVVVGYMKEKFAYLKEKMGVILVENEEYLVRNNHSSIYAVRKYLGNSYICSADNYFTRNPFRPEVEDAYYAAVYAEGETQEWCMETDAEGYVSRVRIGGADAWYMLGHVFWTREFSAKFLEILCDVYEAPETAGMLWEGIYREHLDVLKLRIRKYDEDFIFEFDSLDELREFDHSYIEDTRSSILKQIARKLNCSEAALTNISTIKGRDQTEAEGFRFDYAGTGYEYYYKDRTWRKL